MRKSTHVQYDLQTSDIKYDRNNFKELRMEDIKNRVLHL